jgi:hypothetical protein
MRKIIKSFFGDKIYEIIKILFYSLGNLHINSKGLPNEGYNYYKTLYNKYNSNNKKSIYSYQLK